jgi:undecaprenyl-diphosphatase
LAALGATAAALLLTRSWDLGVFFWLNDLGRHLPLTAELITHLADHGWAAPLLVILLVKQPRLLAAALVAALLIHLSVREFKHYFEVLRPCFAPELAGLVFTAGPQLRIDSYSFPSGHSATAALVAAALVALWGRRAWWPAVVFALLAGASRSLLGAHYPSDITTGLALGLAISATVFYAATRLGALSHTGERVFRLGVWLLAAAVLVFILQQGQHNFPLWFSAVSKFGCVLGLLVLSWQVKNVFWPARGKL